MLNNPSIENNKLCFDAQPQLIGCKEILVHQEASFHDNLNQEYSSNINGKVHDPDLSNKRLIILCNKSQFCHSISKSESNFNMEYTSISNHNTRKREKDIYVMLLLVLHPKKNKTTQKKLLSHEFIKSTNKIKHPNMLSNHGTKHNKSYGKYYGFGLINKYKTSKDGISFGTFQSLKIKNEDHVNQIESYFRSIFNFTASSLNNFLPKILIAGNHLMKELCSAGRKISNNTEFNILTDPKLYGKNNYYSTWLCENARTEQFHQELDASYTLIAVPYLNQFLKSKSKSNYKFQFRWNNIDTCSDSKGIDIPLLEGTCLYYNGYGLYHRKIPNDNNYPTSTFWNLSMYHNQRLMNCISNSICRSK